MSGVLMVYEPTRANRRSFFRLAAVLKIGWRIVAASPEEQAILDAHGFGSGSGAVIAVVYRPPAMTPDDYKASWEGGAPVALPPGLIFHAGVGEGADFATITVWDSRESYDAFAPTFTQVMAEKGLSFRAAADPACSPPAECRRRSRRMRKASPTLTGGLASSRIAGSARPEAKAGVDATQGRARSGDRPQAVPGIGAEVVLTVDGELRKARLFRSHEQVELVGAIADTRAMFEGKGWA